MAYIGNLQNYNCTPITSASTVVVKTSDGALGGVFCSAGTSPTVEIYDNTSATGTPIIATFTMTIGQFYPMPAAIRNGITVVLGGTSPSATVLWV